MLVAVVYNCFSVIVCFQHKSGRCFSHLNMLNWFTFCHVQDIHSLIKRNVQFMVENHVLNYRCFKTHHFGLFYRISLFIVIYSITRFTQFANRTCCPIQIINITLPWISEKKVQFVWFKYQDTTVFKINRYGNVCLQRPNFLTCMSNYTSTVKLAVSVHQT